MADYYAKANFPIISAITKANPGQVTTETAHGLATNDVIAISSVGGMTQVNNLPFTVTVVDSTNFTIGVDTTGYTTYTAAGYVHPGADTATYRGPWLASHAFTAGARVISNTVTSIRMHECTTGGTSGAAQPTFNTTAGNTTADNTVTWTTRLPTTWANAFFRLDSMTPLSTGDRIFVSHQHEEVRDAAGSFNISGVAGAASIQIICVNDANEPPTTLATTAKYRTTRTNTPTITPANTASRMYVYGIQFTAGSGTGSVNCDVYAWGGSTFILEDCRFRLGSTNTGNLIRVASQTGTITFRNCEFSFSNASQSMGNTTTAHNLAIVGGKIASDSAAITGFINAEGGLRVSGFDFSNAATALNICNTVFTERAPYIVVRNCKMPSGWTGDVLVSGTPGAHRIELYNSDNNDTNYRVIVRDRFGTMVQDTGIYNNAGATDGTTRLSWKATTTASALIRPAFVTPEIVRWNETTGSAITATVQILHDSATALKDNEVWLEVQYLGTSGAPLGTFLTDGANAIASGTDQASSSASWTAPGITNVNTQQLSVTFTPEEKGFIHAKVYVAKASYTVYVDPLVTIS